MTSSSPAPPPGLTVDGYELITRLGEGGMGVVHLARRPGEPRVALKVLRPHIIGDDESRQRLAREVNSLSRIRSPRVAEIIDADPWGDIPYVATRYVPGLSLHDHVHEEGVIDGPDLTHFALGLAEALGAVHACGVLHRDIKPSNILLEGRNPVLIDFGLARVADDPRLTHTGWLLGTPGYLAPEILYGDDATTASDVHSWAACVAYAGLGRPPFGRGPGMAIMDRVRRGEHDLSGLPPAMAGLLAAALAPEPHERPTLAEAVEQLQPHPAAATVPHDEAPHTIPLAVAAQAGADDLTGVLSQVVESEPAPATLPYTQHAPHLHAVPAAAPAAVQRAPLQQAPVQRPPLAIPAQPQRPIAPVTPPVGTRMARGLVFLALTVLAAAWIAAIPYVAGAMLLVFAWLLRSGSYAAQAAGARRLLRGRKWFDGPQTLIASPWHLLQAIPGTVALGAWSAGLGLAGALLGYAAGLPMVGIVAGAGLLYAGSLGLGPGGERVRGPLRQVVRPIASRPTAFVVAVAGLLACAALLGVRAMDHGPEWAPSSSGPIPDSLVDLVRNRVN